MAKEIDEKLDILSMTIRHLEIVDNISAAVDDVNLDKLNCAALNLAASILEYLILILEHFKKPAKHELLSLSSIGRPEVLVAIVEDERIIHSSKDFDKAVDRINDAIFIYTDAIRARNPVITRLLWVWRRFRYLSS